MWQGKMNDFKLLGGLLTDRQTNGQTLVVVELLL